MVHGRITKAVLPFLFFSVSTTTFAKPAPGVSGLLSIVPGLGQVANGDGLEGLGYFAASAGLFFGGRKDSAMRHIGFDIWMYNMYDAYRDAGAKDTSKENIFQNYIANFNPLNIIDPIGGSFVVFAAASNGKADHLKGTPRSLGGRIAYYSFVGFGEEALFRGFLFPGISHLFSSKIVGAILSSVIFSAAHREFGSAFTARFLMGLAFCGQVYLNKFDLRKNIFAHTWYDVLVTRNGGYKTTIGIDFKF